MPLPKKMQEKWDKADKTGEPISIGNMVVCDICCADYTNLPDSGGFIFSSKAYCPKCAKKWLPKIKAYGEERFINEFCGHEQSFANFVREYRGANNVIHITKGK